MKTLNRNVRRFKVKVCRPVWECVITDIPKADGKGETAASSQAAETYQGSSDEYVVNVFSDINDIKVEVRDAKGNEVKDFDITDVEYLK